MCHARITPCHVPDALFFPSRKEFEFDFEMGPNLGGGGVEQRYAMLIITRISLKKKQTPAIRV